MTDFISRIGFTGNYEMSLDAKGRLNIPAPFAKVLQSLYPDDQGNLVASLSPEKCVKLIPATVWEEKVNQLAALPDLDEHSRSFMRLTMAHSFPVSLDGNNRVRIPQQLLNVCGVEKDVTVIGAFRSFEVWNRKAWDEFAAKGIEHMVESSQLALQWR